MPGKIEISEFSKSYGAVTAVEDISFEVTSGELFGLIGPDGAGKTSTMRTICTLLPCRTGEIFVDGYNVKNDVAAIRAIIGYMPQRFSLYPDLSVQQNLDFFSDLFGVSKKKKQDRLQQLYQFSKLAPFKDRLAGALSGGMKQKLALSCTLIHTPRILILDEPTTGVDPVSRREFWQILKQLRDDGVTVLVSTPYMDEASLCDRVAFMFEGGIMVVDEPGKLPEHFPFRLYEVRADDVRKLVPYFTETTAPVSVQVFGDRLHVSYTESLTEESCLEIVENAPYVIEQLSAIKPSIEDTFLALMKTEEA